MKLTKNQIKLIKLYILWEKNYICVKEYHYEGEKLNLMAGDWSLMRSIAETLLCNISTKQLIELTKFVKKNKDRDFNANLEKEFYKRMNITKNQFEIEKLKLKIKELEKESE